MLHLPALYPITDATRPESLSDQIRRLGESGYSLVQFRGKPLDAKTQWEELRKALLAAAANGGWPRICVNDRADLALLAAREGLMPWGLHLGQADLPAAAAQALPGLGSCHFGASTHEPSEWGGVSAPFDHAGVGPYRRTGTKADHAAPIGLPGLRAGCAALRARGVAPIAIGGLTYLDAAACFEAGAESVAMVGEVHRNEDPANLGWRVQRLRWRIRPPFRRGQGLVLLGGSGAGKSTVGRQLALRLGLPFRDLDSVIEAREGRPIAEIFATSGEAAFRALETVLLPELLTSPAVVALGGGAWAAPVNRAAAAAADTVPLWLAEAPQRAWQRAGKDPNRPLAQDQTAFLARWAARMPTWTQAEPIHGFGHTSRELVSALLD